MENYVGSTQSQIPVEITCGDFTCKQRPDLLCLKMQTELG